MKKTMVISFIAAAMLLILCTACHVAESHRSRQQHSQRTEFGTVKGHRQSQQGRDKTGYGQCPYKDAGV